MTSLWCCSRQWQSHYLTPTIQSVPRVENTLYFNIKDAYTFKFFYTKLKQSILLPLLSPHVELRVVWPRNPELVLCGLKVLSLTCTQQPWSMSALCCWLAEMLYGSVQATLFSFLKASMIKITINQSTAHSFLYCNTKHFNFFPNPFYSALFSLSNRQMDWSVSTKGIEVRRAQEIHQINHTSGQNLRPPHT